MEVKRKNQIILFQYNIKNNNFKDWRRPNHALGEEGEVCLAGLHLSRLFLRHVVVSIA